MSRFPDAGENDPSAIPPFGSANADAFPSRPERTPDPKEQRRRALSCGKCGSGDIWRVGAKEENVFLTFLHRGLKPFQCRACGDHFHQQARRRSDSRAPISEKLPDSKKARSAVTWVRVMAPSLAAMGLLVGGWQWRHLSADPAAGRPTLNLTAATLLSSAKPLTNDDVITLKIAGLGDSVVIARTRSSPGAYRLEADDLVQLRRVGISDAVISAMLAAQSR